MRIAALLTASVCMVAPAAAGEVELILDQAKLYSLDRPIGRLIVANPAIADIAVHSNKELILFGKMPGMTNLFVFDADGKPMGNVTLRVANPRKNMVTVYAGAVRTTMSCGTVCEHTYTIGDGVNGLGLQGTNVGAQATTRFDMAGTASGGSSNERTTPTISPAEDPES